MIAGQQDDGLVEPIELRRCPVEQVVTHPTVIEQISSNEHRVHVLGQRQVDRAGERFLLAIRLIGAEVAIRHVQHLRRWPPIIRRHERAAGWRLDMCPKYPPSKWESHMDMS